MQSIESVLTFAWALGRACLRHVVAVVASVIVCVVLAVLIATSRPPQYAASMTVKAADEQVSGTSNVTLHLPGLSALAGTLPAYLKLLQSHEVAQLLIDREHFDRALFWGGVDAKTGLWKRHPSFLDRTTDSLFGIDRAPGPAAEDVQRMLASMLVIDRDAFSDLATISCTSPSRTLCAALLAAAHRQTEYRMRQILLGQALRTRAYVAAALPGTRDPELRTAMTEAQAEADNHILAADMLAPAGAVVLEPPQTPVRPVAPHPGAVLVLGALLGLVIGMTIAWALDGRRRKA